MFAQTYLLSPKFSQFNTAVYALILYCMTNATYTITAAETAW